MQLYAHPQAAWIHLGVHATGRHFVRCAVCKIEGFLNDGVPPDPFVAQHLNHGSATHHGLGDAVARATSAVGIKPCAPCEQRKQILNHWFPNFRRK